MNRNKTHQTPLQKTPEGSRVICVDEFGPLEIRPVGGATWAVQKHPVRQSATYTRKHGVRPLLAAYDLQGYKLTGQIKKRKRPQEFLTFLKSVRNRYPVEERLYLVMDN